MDGTTIKQGVQFKASDVVLFEFKSCLIDSDSNDNDPSTIDNYNSVVSTCIPVYLILLNISHAYQNKLMPIYLHDIHIIH